MPAIAVRLTPSAVPQDVVAALEAKGLTRVSYVARAHFIFADCDDARLDEVRALPGVAEVRRQSGVQLPPIDERLPQ